MAAKKPDFLDYASDLQTNTSSTDLYGPPDSPDLPQRPHLSEASVRPWALLKRHVSSVTNDCQDYSSQSPVVICAPDPYIGRESLDIPRKQCSVDNPCPDLGEHSQASSFLFKEFGNIVPQSSRFQLPGREKSDTNTSFLFKEFGNIVPQSSRFQLPGREKSDTNTTREQSGLQYSSYAIRAACDIASPSSNGMLVASPSVKNSKMNFMPSADHAVLHLNNQCFEAAVNENFGQKSETTIKYVTKMKHLNRKCHKHFVYPNCLTASCRDNQPHVLDDSQTNVCDKGMEHADNSTTSQSRNTGNPAATHSPVLCSTYQDDKKVPKLLSNLDIKRYRYNQTALALQQSGLMKSTITTAQLLRQSRLLQLELAKLRWETALFVKSVLSNPENKHLRDKYLAAKLNKMQD